MFKLSYLIPIASAAVSITTC